MVRAELRSRAKRSFEQRVLYVSSGSEANDGFAVGIEITIHCLRGVAEGGGHCGGGEVVRPKMAVLAGPRGPSSAAFFRWPVSCQSL